MTQRIIEILQGRRTVAFLGEAGSGKTEIALNFALRLRGETDRKIHFFDMDQTKPLFRARDVAERLRQMNIEFHSNTDISIEDVAAIAPGVIPVLNDTESFVIMDVGGNEHGARVIGQFCELLSREDAMVMLPINPFRPWSGNPDNLALTIDKITTAARAKTVKVISNPNLCRETTADDVVEGNETLRQMLQNRYEIACVCALTPLCAELEQRMDEAVVPIEIQIIYPWMDEYEDA
ncbi:MAG: hypothetical protein E7472_03855 [Ruminococcaceae bacterium]|nr:hypothetical protein [Oscillospiraceae bacterium]